MSQQTRNMDWKLCLICQNATKEVLQCPLNTLGSANLLTPHETFLEHSAMFHELDRLAVPIGHNITAKEKLAQVLSQEI